MRGGGAERQGAAANTFACSTLCSARSLTAAAAAYCATADFCAAAASGVQRSILRSPLLYARGLFKESLETLFAAAEGSTTPSIGGGQERTGRWALPKQCTLMTSQKEAGTVLCEFSTQKCSVTTKPRGTNKKRKRHRPSMPVPDCSFVKCIEVKKSQP